jgi:hypothetical protein
MSCELLPISDSIPAQVIRYRKKLRTIPRSANG